MNDPVELYGKAIDAFNRADWRLAKQLATSASLHAPRHGGVHFIIGTAALQLNRLPLALHHLRLATEYGTDRADYGAQYARALSMAHRLDEATRIADQSMTLASCDAASFNTFGMVYSRAHLHGLAIAAFQRAAELSPDRASYRFDLATSFMYFGDLAAAGREYEACVEIDRRYWRAYLALSQLRRHSAQDNHVERLQALLREHGYDDEARLYLHLSVAKELEDFGEYAKAFGHYVSGKAAHRSRIGNSSQRDANTFDAIRRYFDKPRADAIGHDSGEPLFVIGMPRSGTTLTDRILGAHSEVHSAGELNNFGLVLQRAADGKPGRSPAESFANFNPSAARWADIGHAYVESTRPGSGNTPHFVDKLPHNFLYAGFIARALPQAKIICVRRNPMDTCLSNFRQLFATEASDFDYSYDLLDTGRYYLQFDRLMKYWQDLLPGRILEFDYEQLVEAQEDTTRMLLAFCGLPWEAGCLAFESNAAPVATASAVQVRARINRDSLHRWRHYEAQLEGLRRLLEQGGIQIN